MSWSSFRRHLYSVSLSARSTGRWIQWSSSIAYQQLSVHCSACDKQRFHSFIHPVILSSSLRFPAIPKRLSAASFTDVRWQSFYSSHPAVSHNGVKCIDVGIHLKCRNSVPHTVPVLRLLHTTSGDQGERDSKVDKTLVALKDSAKKVTPEKKKTLWARFKAEMVHYYHGFRLLFIDIRVAVRLVWQVLRGRSLVRRERQQLVRTTADMFRLVPFSVFIIVPFAEFLLPVALKLFPGMLPSTFADSDRELEKRRKRLKVKLEMAKFLQDTIEETALQRRDGSGTEGEATVQEFVKFMDEIRMSGVRTSNEEILRFSKLFEDEITLDNLTYDQLRALCRLVDLPTVGTSYFLRFQLQMKLRQLEADDRLIEKEGIDTLAVWELQDACRTRGMRSLGMSEQRLKYQLSEWLDLHLNYKIPTSLLLLSRALYLPEHLTAEDQLKATISVLPEATAEEAKVKILEVAGDRVDNKSKLEVIRQEEEIIRREKEERRQEEEAEKLAKVKVLTEAAADVIQPEAQKLAAEELTDKAPELVTPGEEKITEIDAEDLEKIEDVFEHIAESRRELGLEVEDLAALKEDITEYQENLEDVRDVVKSSHGALSDLTESKSAQRLSRKVTQMIGQMDELVTELSARKEVLIGDIEAKKGRVEVRADGKEPISDDRKKEILDEISKKQNNLVTITEMLESLQKLQNVSDSSKYEKIARVLDEDHDGVVDKAVVMEVIELLEEEDVKLSPEQLTSIMSIIHKERRILEENKQQKTEERKQQQEQQPVSQDDIQQQKQS